MKHVTETCVLLTQLVLGKEIDLWRNVPEPIVHRCGSYISAVPERFAPNSFPPLDVSPPERFVPGRFAPERFAPKF